jgi:hypothetical protein
MGLWYLFLGVSGFATLFDFGFGPTITRNITYADSGVVCAVIVIMSLILQAVL